MTDAEGNVTLNEYDEAGQRVDLALPFEAVRRGEAPWPSVTLVGGDQQTQPTVGGVALKVE